MVLTDLRGATGQAILWERAAYDALPSLGIISFCSFNVVTYMVVAPGGQLRFLSVSLSPFFTMTLGGQSRLKV